jgi:hypothetical protein
LALPREEPKEPPSEDSELILFIAFWTPEDIPEKELPKEPVLLLRISVAIVPEGT